MVFLYLLFKIVVTKVRWSELFALLEALLDV